jgi:hypothetical protein
MTTGSGSTWRQRWPELLDGLTGEQRRAVSTAVADNVLEGWQPSREDIQALVDIVTGRTSTEDYIRSVRVGMSVR